MPFFSKVSATADTQSALEDILADLSSWGPVDLALVFYSPHHRKEAGRIAEFVYSRLQPRSLLGCPGETIIGTGIEIESGPAISLWLGRWGDEVEITPFHLTLEETSEGQSLLGWPDDLAEAMPDEAMILTVADPFTFPVDDFLTEVNEARPGLRVVGGMASGVQAPGQTALLIGAQAVDQGAVGVLLRGPIQARTVVSQGCRPIGRPMVITKAQGNAIIDLGGKSAFAQLQAIWQESPLRDRELVQRGLHVGRAISEYKASFHPGDFLIRNVIGIDRASGAIAVTESVRVGQTVQFHVRDATTADEDLHMLLKVDRRLHPQQAGGALLFSCNGRGTRLFGTPNHDAGVVQSGLGAIPLAGFFAQGELGPVGGQNFIHGFTASLVIFDE